MKRARENYAKLVYEYQNLRISYDRQVEMNVALESKLQDVAVEAARRATCQNPACDALGGNWLF